MFFLGHHSSVEQYGGRWWVAVAYIEKEYMTEICALCDLELAVLRKQISKSQRENAKASAVFKPHKYCSFSALRRVYTRK